ncbi:MAG: hypothetical protein CM1200mP40_11030 [Gammaproteobacteria bacterium]|nr:MAG: hypothetical protein CM1200mP40_11030 [Gammaproteobacteria bacterium]
MLSTNDISGDGWNGKNPRKRGTAPEFDWEGANAPLEPSVRSTAYGIVNQLRDPALHIEDGIVYLLYAVAGESGIALARVDF